MNRTRSAIEDEVRFRGRKQYSSWRARVPSHWGKRTWDALFLLAADYPHEQSCWDDEEMDEESVRARKRAWRRLLTSLPWVLACGVCAQHFQEYLERDGGRALSKALENRETLYDFLYRCKAEVNKRNGKHSPPLGKIRRKYIPHCEKRSRRRRS